MATKTITRVSSSGNYTVTECDNPSGYPADGTRRLYEALEMAAFRLAWRYHGRNADTLTAWLAYLLQRLETHLGDSEQCAQVIKDLRRDLEARERNGSW